MRRSIVSSGASVEVEHGISDRRRRAYADRQTAWWPEGRICHRSWRLRHRERHSSAQALHAEHVDYVVMGHVLQAGTGQIPARQAAVKGGIAMSVPAVTINKVCLSGLNAVALADQLIRAGECDVVVAGGMESMTQAPHLLPRSRSGFKYGDVTMIDHMAYDGLWDAFTDQAMGSLTDGCNRGEQLVSREDQDAFAARSHQRAAAATTSGAMAEEIVEVRIPQRRGDDVVISRDEGIREGVTAESLAKLTPAFGRDGSITAGSSSPISDGAAAMVVASKEAAARLGTHADRRDRRARERCRPGLVAAAAAGKRDQPCGEEATDQRLRPGPDRDQRGIRRRRCCERASSGPERRRDRRAGERQWWCDRARPSDRCLGRSAAADLCDGAASDVAAVPASLHSAAVVGRAMP